MQRHRNEQKSTPAGAFQHVSIPGVNAEGSSGRVRMGEFEGHKTDFVMSDGRQASSED